MTGPSPRLPLRLRMCISSLRYCRERTRMHACQRLSDVRSLSECPHHDAPCGPRPGHAVPARLGRASNRIETREGRGLFRIEGPSLCWCQPHYCGRRSAFRASLAAVWSSLATTSPTSITCQLVSAPPVVRRVVTDTLRMCGTGRPSLQAATAV